MTLPAWALVLLYKHRWDIKKVFDELKTKLEEHRSWASSPEAKKAHANFLCLTHNLMLLLENHLCKNEKMEDQVEPKKKLIRARSLHSDRKPPKQMSFINGFFTRATQRTVRFIRWLRYGLSHQLLYRDSLAELAIVRECTIT